MYLSILVYCHRYMLSFDPGQMPHNGMVDDWLSHSAHFARVEWRPCAHTLRHSVRRAVTRHTAGHHALVRQVRSDAPFTPTAGGMARPLPLGLLAWPRAPARHAQEGVTVLHSSAFNGHVEVAQLLLDRGASVNAAMQVWKPLATRSVLTRLYSANPRSSPLISACQTAQ